MAAAIFVTPPALAPPGQPDITYAPDYGKYQARRDQRIKSAGLPGGLPRGLPQQLTGKLVWEGDTLGDTYKWTYVLEPSQLEEINLALRHFQCRW